LGGVKIDSRDREVQKHFAYVSQQDALHESSTPRESLMFSAKLRLPKTTTDDFIEDLVSGMIEELGLGSCCDTIIGGTFRKGISGGEKRRVSIGLELVAHPNVIFADEPTSGLGKRAQVLLLLYAD
jgi:ABC-type multidrug transport system ATPase subunit